ncbi:hypothetical protein OF83DRAFT_1109470 [Amylostereum chailletii]|nr:hypothetical protein OF83DRAFT_1109470 [Amylostereum chailletii]
MTSPRLTILNIHPVNSSQAPPSRKRIKARTSLENPPCPLPLSPFSPTSSRHCSLMSARAIRRLSGNGNTANARSRPTSAKTVRAPRRISAERPRRSRRTEGDGMPRTFHSPLSMPLGLPAPHPNPTSPKERIKDLEWVVKMEQRVQDYTLRCVAAHVVAARLGTDAFIAIASCRADARLPSLISAFLTAFLERVLAPDLGRSPFKTEIKSVKIVLKTLGLLREIAQDLARVRVLANGTGARVVALVPEKPILEVNVSVELVTRAKAMA